MTVSINIYFQVDFKKLLLIFQYIHLALFTSKHDSTQCNFYLFISLQFKLDKNSMKQSCNNWVYLI